MALPRWFRGSAPSAAAHGGWERLIEALHAAELATELDAGTLRAMIGRLADLAPDLDVVAAVLDLYYRGGGDAGAALRRAREDRVVAIRERDGTTARQVVSKLRLAVPELGALALVEEPAPRFLWASNFLLRTRGGMSALPVAAMELEPVSLRDGEYLRRTVTVRAIIGAANAILGRRGIAWRFVPIESPDGVETYVAVQRDQAMLLDVADVLAEPLESLLGLAAWRSDPPQATPSRPTRTPPRGLSRVA